MTKFVGGARSIGKSSALIEQAVKEDKYILVATDTHKKHLKDLAINLDRKVDILSVYDLQKKGWNDSRKLSKGLIVDEIELVLSYAIRSEISLFSTSAEFRPIGKRILYEVN